jgi:hypothetical protein
MTENEREALSRKLKRIGEMQSNIREHMKPFELTLRLLGEMADEALEAAGITDEASNCEGCERLLIPGDLVHTFSDGPIFCEACAPTYGDIVKEYEATSEQNLQSWLDDDRSKTEIVAAVAAHDPNQKAVHPL